MSAKSEITALGYVVVTTENLPAWHSFAESVLGLQVNRSLTTDATSAMYFRMDEWDWRIAVERGDDGGLAALGFEVENRHALEQLRARLTGEGAATQSPPDLAARRRVLDVFQAQDPDGNVVEFFCGGRKGRTPFVSPHGARFVTGAQGLGHAVLGVSDVSRTERFYGEVLGFRLTDVISVGPMTLYFTSPNSRHHTIAYGDMPPLGLQHILLEVDDIDAVGRALDRAHDGGIPIIASLGRHTNDRMLSFYCASPSGLFIEYGWGGRVLTGEARTTEFYAQASVWGHRLADGTDPSAIQEAGQ
jgi:3,4-dihydroxy-9,10-secoandrosta-1,3,5(10)-triene-9,17-dione 4,5-dioxygenase